MSFYHSPQGVSDYIRMAEGYDGRKLITSLEGHLDQNGHVLEIGMGPGVDLDLLSTRFRVTGSDFSQRFLDRYKKKHPDADLVLLDAITLETNRTFDAVYSNKVLHHLDDEELRRSIQRQCHILNPGGVVLHSFWYGRRTEEHSGMKFYYRDETFLRDVFSPRFEVIELERYTEMEDDDSIMVLARRRN